MSLNCVVYLDSNGVILSASITCLLVAVFSPNCLNNNDYIKVYLRDFWLHSTLVLDSEN